MNIINAPINQIKPNPSNPRVIRDEKFKKLLKSIQDFPEMLTLRPIVVNDDMVVLGGNMRLRACQELKIKEIPIVMARDLTPEQQREFIIKDNVGYGEWDWAMLSNDFEVQELEEWGLDVPDSFGVNEIPEPQEDDYEIPDEIQTDIVLGDLFEIGNHRLLCGDSTDSEQVAKLMNGEEPDMVFTDPPYGINLKYVGVMANNTNGRIKNDDIEYNPKFILSLFNNAIYYFFGADYYIEKLPNRKNLCIWAKSHSEKENQVFGASFESFWRSKPAYRDIWYEKRITHTNENQGKHPTQKPISIPSRCILESKAKHILDCFLGSGSTMVAAHQLNRKCYGMELEPKYCQVIIDRMRKLDPSLKIKRNGTEI